MYTQSPFYQPQLSSLPFPYSSQLLPEGEYFSNLSVGPSAYEPAQGGGEGLPDPSSGGECRNGECETRKDHDDNACLCWCHAQCTASKKAPEAYKCLCSYHRIEERNGKRSRKLNPSLCRCSCNVCTTRLSRWNKEHKKRQREPDSHESELEALKETVRKQQEEMARQQEEMARQQQEMMRILANQRRGQSLTPLEAELANHARRPRGPDNVFTAFAQMCGAVQITGTCDVCGRKDTINVADIASWVGGRDVPCKRPGCNGTSVVLRL